MHFHFRQIFLPFSASAEVDPVAPTPLLGAKLMVFTNVRRTVFRCGCLSIHCERRL